MRFRLRYLCFLLLPLLAGAEEEPLLRYDVRIRGVRDRTLRRELMAVSQLQELKNRPPRTELQLRARARRDLPRFETLLRSHGHYAPTMDIEFLLDRRRPRVQFRIDPGALYTLRETGVRFEGTDAPGFDFGGDAIGLPSGSPARADRIRQADEAALLELRRRGHPFPRILSREVRVYHAEQAVDVWLTVDPGSSFRFGATGFAGLRRVDEAFLRGKIPWEEGDVYNSDAVRLLRRRLADADLFQSIHLLTGLPEEGEDRVPMRVELQERRHRSLTLGGGYNSDEGWRARAGWEHRNLLSRGERLSLDFAVSEINSFSEISFRRPDLRRTDQTLTLSARHTVEDTRAFDSRKSDVLARLDRPLRNGWTGGAGLGVRRSRVEDVQDDENFILLYAPLRLDRDRSDDLLDPRRGDRLSLGTAPYWDPEEGDLFFLKSRAAYTYYRPLLRRPFPVDSATRVSYSVATGASRDSIPADERLYAGGGGTLRGYAFQTVGPLSDDTPLGGRSMLLLGQELRLRLSEFLGLTLFVDGGAVTEEALFNADVDEFRWGTGFGLRYFTPVGPLRIDMAFPVDRRDIDSPWQFYISLGQAF